MKQYEKKILYPELGIKGLIYGSCPVQAEGEINQFPFYFWARHDEWTFAISETEGISPLEIHTIDAGRKYGFFVEKIFGQKGGEDAGYMELETAEDLILNCFKEYILKKKDLN